MGSSQPPNQGGPFGYSFDGMSSSAFPFPSPPAPAPGPALLDDTESNFLNSFFDGVNSDHFNGDFFNTATDGTEIMGYGWQDLPPTFMGTQTSFGQQPLHQPHDTVPGMLFPDASNGNMGLGSGQGLQTTTEADIMAAASLLQNGHGHGNISHHFPAAGTLPLFDQTRPPHVPPPQLSRPRESVSYDQSRPTTSPPKNNNWVGDTFYTEMMYGSVASGGRQQPRSPPKAADIQWGSDVAFGSGQGFVAPANHKVEADAAEQNMMNILGQLEPQSSTAASTRPSSPIVSRHADSFRQRADVDSHHRDYADEEDRPTKRRKSSKMKFDDFSDDEGSPPSKAPKKRRPKSLSSARPSSAAQSPPASKRRKSLAAAAAKANRENLTEDQKRENHIKSEQKRRTLIKEGFEDLGELVPDLKGGGHSKSAVLVMAADWLEDLIKGNEELRGRIRAMEKGLKGF